MRPRASKGLIPPGTEYSEVAGCGAGLRVPGGLGHLGVSCPLGAEAPCVGPMGPDVTLQGHPLLLLPLHLQSGPWDSSGSHPLHGPAHNLLLVAPWGLLHGDTRSDGAPSAGCLPRLPTQSQKPHPLWPQGTLSPPD